MLNTHKLLYIFPDVAYVAELLPTKQEHKFAVQSFRQINGEFMDDRVFIPENVGKLLNKLDKDDYHLVLPDFLFTNTILEVRETTQTKVDAELNDTVLPSLGMTDDSHYLDTFTLTQFKDISKVQLTALDRELIQAIVNGQDQADAKITGVSPVSWTTKAMISLEPSISVIQLGSMLYLAQHYIGVDQTSHAELDNVEKLAETVKTLKGAEPSIQTLYLLTNELVESKLKELVSDTLPIQQLTEATGTDSEMPAFVKQIIETGMRTMDITDFPVPKFDISKQKTGDISANATPQTKSEDTKQTETTTEKTHQEMEPAMTTNDALPEPAKPASVTTDQKSEANSDTNPTPPAPEIPAPAAVPTPKPQEPKPETKTEAKEEKTEPIMDIPVSPDTPTNPSPTTPPAPEIPAPAAVPTPKPQEPKPETKPTEAEKVPAPEPTVATVTTGDESSKKEDKPTSTVVTPTPAKYIIKNQNNTGSMLKMIFITLAVLFTTVAVGVGIGLGLLNLSNRGDNLDTSPVVVETPDPSPQPSPSPSPEPVSINPEELSIYVVNATRIPGKAGDIQDLLDDAEYGETGAGNAQGDYDLGTNYVLMAEENRALIEALEDATDLSLTFDNNVTVEDPDEEYDAVIVFGDDAADDGDEEANETESAETTDDESADSEAETTEE